MGGLLAWLPGQRRRAGHHHLTHFTIMSISRSTLTRGPAYAAFKGANFQFAGDSKIEIIPTTQVVRAALYGKIDETVSDLAIRCTGTPLTWTSLSVLFPYLTPSVGQRLYGNADLLLVWASSNGDVITLANAAITRMPLSLRSCRNRRHYRWRLTAARFWLHRAWPRAGALCLLVLP